MSNPPSPSHNPMPSNVRHTVLALVFVAEIAAAQSPRPSAAALNRLGQDLRGIAALLRVPGMAAGVVAGDSLVWQIAIGEADTAQHVKVDAHTAFPIASITKTMAAVVIMQLVDSGRLSLDDTVGRFLNVSPDLGRVSVRHLLSHTSEGTLGEVYLYSGARYGALGRIAARVTGRPFASLLDDGVFAPASMPLTVAPPDVSAASGVVSTVEDLARYTSVVASAKLTSASALRGMWSATRSTDGRTLPYGLGWFVQDYAGEHMVWHYGQETAYASLLIYLPARRLGFVMLTNSSAASDAFRLLDGNLARSLPAIAFLRIALGERPELTRDAIVDSALAQLYVNDLAASATTLRRAIASNPEIARAPDLSTFYLILRLRDPVADSVGDAMVPRLLESNPHSPPVLFNVGAFYGRTQRESASSAMYERLAELPNAPRHWSVVLGLMALADRYAEREPARARKYAERVVAMNYNFGGAVDRARALLARVP